MRMTTGFSSSWGRKVTSGVSRKKSLSSSAAAITGEEEGEGGEGGTRGTGRNEREGERRGGERKGGEKSDVTLQTTTEYGLFISDTERHCGQLIMVTCRRTVAVISTCPA